MANASRLVSKSGSKPKVVVKNASWGRNRFFKAWTVKGSGAMRADPNSAQREDAKATVQPW